MRRTFTLLLVTSFITIILPFTSGAQQDVQLSQFMFDRLSINPASAGMSDNICVTGIYRNQWIGFEGSPKTTLFNFQMPLAALHGGVGFTYYNDQLGFESNNIARLHYSYHTHLSSTGLDDFGIGASVGILSKSINPNWVTPDGTIWSLDPSIAAPGSSATTSDFSLGAYYRTPKLYLGISSTHLTESSLQNMNVQSARHYWIMAGYKYQIPASPQWELRPNIVAKSDAASTQIDINTLVYFRGAVWGGLSYRVADAVVPMFGVKHSLTSATLTFGCSYDVTTSNIRTYSSGTLEIMLGICFHGNSKEYQRYTNPR